MYISRVVTYMHTEYYVLRCTPWVSIHTLNHEPSVITDDVCIVYTLQEVVLHVGILGAGPCFTVSAQTRNVAQRNEIPLVASVEIEKTMATHGEFSSNSWQLRIWLWWFTGFWGIALPFCSVDDRFLYAMTCRRKAMEFYAVTRKAVHLCAQSTQRVNWRITISKLPDFSGWNIPIDPVNRIDKWSIVVSKVDEQPENPSRMWFRLLQDSVSMINTHRKPLRDILEMCFALESVAKG